ncbi:5'-nucleotidase, lipoprotein e(P4) family [Erythrobacter sp. SD-21]|uniref:5'-nucleotidase, lipoprotein e(P4) family n=1 Tax=Erythrobacter sp. SD-21 TaxID=161528 RepID=UPI000153FA55|nr:HAD family acid phosphatase [Erythrobacter sp. SD-21]EDL49123.1 acid phosphatase [Erythrobacter sp. SD-21]
MMRGTLVSLAALALGACATIPAPEAPIAPGLDAEAPDSMQWLYGSGEAAGASIQAWRGLADYAVARSRERRVPQSVAMGVGGVVAAPQLCSDGETIKPLAVVFDVDETVLLNTGYEYWVAATGNSYSRETWKLWEETGASYIRPVPGAVTGLRRLREAGITPVFNTNRQYSPEGAAKAIAAAGLGEAVHRETLFLRGDDGVDSGDKDGRRALIAERYCVIALAGDNLGDFADIFNDDNLPAAERRELAARGDLAQLWGNGWFVLPNPVYGDSLKGTVGEVYPEGTRWSPATAPSAAPAIMNEGN